MSLPSYTKVLALGHRGLELLFAGRVIAQEKIDGSQFSFGIIDGVLEIRSRKARIDVDAPANLFAPAVEWIRDVVLDGLTPGYVYRGEAVCRPKHNVLAYERTPEGGVILFDVDKGNQDYMLPDELSAEGARLGIEVVPNLFDGELRGESAADFARGLMERISVLGAQKIEGIVIKNYEAFGRDGKTLMGKYVSEAFKEVHDKDWKDRNPNKGDVLDEICKALTSEARWNKAVQHMREDGTLLGEPKDIGPLIKEIIRDTLDEEGDMIRQRLFNWAKEQIARRVTYGFPEWYKGKLLEAQEVPSE